MMNSFQQLIGEAAEFQSVIRSAQIVASTDVTVLLEGATGTGKEVMAEALHTASLRSNKPFITINCAALPESLVESELFGHKKGAFTGADSDQPGYIRQAAGGTLFLDEIGELPVTVQAKLLRFIEYGECQRLGDSQTQKVNVRLIAATNRDLKAQVAAGLFRDDLYYRLKIVPLELPTLQRRQGDIVLLARHFIHQLAQQHRLEAPVFTAAAIKLMQAYKWPGNIRELRNMCERLVVLLPGQRITEHNLPLEMSQVESSVNGFRLPSNGVNLENLEVDLIHQALGMSRGNKSRAARLLGISRDAFLYRLKKYAIA